MRERYETLKLNDLREIAKKRGIKGATGMKKSEIIDLMCELDEKEAAAKSASEPSKDGGKEEGKASVQKPKKKIVVASGNATVKAAADTGSKEKKEPAKRQTEDNPKETTQTKEEAPEAEAIDGDQASGILEVMQDGYGFIRCENYLPGENDVYVAPSLIRKFNLKTGDILNGLCRAKKETDKFAALLRLDTVNGYKPEVAMGRWDFEKMTPIFPNNKIRLEQPGSSVAMRIMDLISPIGKGQRGMIVSPPKAGKTTLLKEVAKSILKGNSDIHLIILLIDERPEEVTDIKEEVEGPNAEVIYSTFDELPEHHK